MCNAYAEFAARMLIARQENISTADVISRDYKDYQTQKSETKQLKEKFSFWLWFKQNLSIKSD